MKSMAEQNGYLAAIEFPTPDGNGQIDFVIQKGAERFAVEVSLSTDATWELHKFKRYCSRIYDRYLVFE